MRPVRLTDILHTFREQSSMPVELADLNAALQSLETEGVIQVAGDRDRRVVRIV